MEIRQQLNATIDNSSSYTATIELNSWIGIAQINSKKLIGEIIELINLTGS